MGFQAVSLHDNIGIRPLVLGVISTFFATVFVILRFYAHRITKAPYASHDTMILVALVKNLS